MDPIDRTPLHTELQRDASPRVEPARAARPADYALLVTSALGSIVALALPVDTTAPPITVCLVAALAGFLLLVRGAGVDLPRRVLVLAISAVFLVAVIAPPRRSLDLWAYASYGRLVAEHHQNPYVHRPSEHPDDLVVQHMSPGWRRSRTVYGPVFTAMSTAIVVVTDGRPLPTRLAFQGIAALSMAVCMYLVARRRDGPLPLLLLGLHPLVTVYLINGGHNDALLAALTVAAALAATSGRHRRAGVLLGLAIGIKAVAVLAAVALVWWVARGAGRRAAAAVAGTAGAMTAIGYLVVGGTRAIEPLLAASRYHSRATIWRPLIGVLVSHEMETVRVGMLGSAVVVTLGLLLASEHRDDRTPYLIVAAPLVAFVLAAAYVLPWYLLWAMPLLALQPRDRMSRALLVVSSVIVLAYQYPSGSGGPLDDLLGGTIDGTLIAQLAAIVLLSTAAVRARLARRSAASGGVPVGGPT